MRVPFVIFIVLCSMELFSGVTWKRPPVLAGLGEARHDGRGLAVVVFFSVDCAACFEELFELRGMIEKLTVPIELIGVSRGDRAGLEEFMDRYRVDIPLVLDKRKELFKKYKVTFVPYKLILAGDDVIYRDDGLARREVQYEELRKCLISVSSRSPAG